MAAPPKSNRALADLRGTILLVGAGKMGSALLDGWLALGVSPTQLVVLEPQPSAAVAALSAKGVLLNPSPTTAREVAVAVLAVKPQMAAEVIPALRPFLTASTLVVSIMAGRSLRFLLAALPGQPLVRAMPNTPAAIGRGITVLVAGSGMTGARRELAHALLNAVGAVEWIEHESLMDAVTALSGSGPAYVFLLAETMAAAGVAAGLPPDLAAKLARATVAGSGELLHSSPLDPATLRQNVTSPGGTTAAALGVLMGEGGLEALIRRAILAATARSRELAG